MIDELKARGADGFYYLAHPYTASNRSAVRRNLQNSIEVFAHLVAAGIVVYHPTSACHEALSYINLPTDHNYWERQNRPFIRGAVGLIVARTTGWERSLGVRHEMDTAVLYNKPIYLARMVAGKLEVMAWEVESLS